MSSDRVVDGLSREMENQRLRWEPMVTTLFFTSQFRAVGGSAGKNFNSPDLKTLRERLLTTVAASSAHLGKEEKRKRSGVLEDRPHLTSNFVLLPAGQQPSLAACLKDVPPSSQESLLLQV